MAKDEITPEMIDLQKKLFNNDFIKNIALSKFGDQTDRYGSFGKDNLERTYMKTASQVPNQEAYEVLFGEAVLGDSSITKERLKQNALKVWSSSMAYQNTKDIAEKMGIKSIDEKYSSKMISELDEEMQKTVSSTYLQYEMTGLMKQGLMDEQKAITNELEKILFEKEDKKDSEKKK